MQKYEIINLKLNQWSDSEIQRQFGVSRNTTRKYWREYQEKLALLLKDDPDLDVRKVIEELVLSPHYDSSNRTCRKYNAEIDNLLEKILEEEKLKKKNLGSNKQQLTKLQIHELICADGYDISYTTIRNKINEKLNKNKECFIRQEYEYGQRFEYDFGEVKLLIANQPIKAFLAVLTAPASGYRWAYLYHNCKMEVFLDSQVRFFEMIGGCFKEGVYDNMKNVVTKFIGRNEKQINFELIKLATYYGFHINVTNCYSGNEKGTVEGAVKWIRNKVFAARYKFDSFKEAEDYLQDRLKELNSTTNIELEKKHLSFYRPKYEFAAIESLHVDKYSFIRIDNNLYSVPEDLVDKYVTVKIYPNNIDIYYKNNKVASHNKLIGQKKTCIDIRHYLNTFLRKPGALKNSTALKSVPRLKDIFDTYYKDNPKTFIDILLANKNKTIEEIIEIIGIEHCLKPAKEDLVSKACDKQIEQITKLFLGGNTYVH